MNYYHQGKALLDAGSIKEAAYLFAQGLTDHDPHCAYGLLAATAMQGEDCSAAIAQLGKVWPQLQALANDGESDACFILGRCYETGSCVEPDIHEAMRCYTQAAAKGNLDAMFNLGCIYIQFGGSGTLIARDYFQSAAEQGHCHAQLALSHYYAVEGNTELSLYWRQKAEPQT